MGETDLSQEHDSEAVVIEEPIGGEPDPGEVNPEEIEVSVEEIAHTSLTDVMDARGNYLEALRCHVFLDELPEGREAYYSNFVLSGQEPEEKQKEFIRELQSTARDCLKVREQQKLYEEAQAKKTEEEKTAEEEKPEVEIKPLNAQIGVKISSDRMFAWVFAFPPEHGGKEISPDLIHEALAECGVVSGINEEALRQITVKKAYLKLVTVAEGKPEVDGIDGQVLDHFPRVSRSTFGEQEEQADQTVNYKNLNWLHHIITDEVICDIVYPVSAIDGYDVMGKTLRGRIAKPVILPSGSNTRLTEDKLQLVSKLDGTIFYEDNKFHVKDVLNILSDVDLSVGNIDTVGHLEVKGDVLSGFTIQATGNVNIRGMVGNSTVVAGGDIKVGMGVRGCGNALLNAGGNIQSHYIENCTVKARGSINSGSIINCDLVSDGSIECKTIVGGNISALRQIHVKTVGNSQRRQTTFSLGVTQELMQEKKDLECRIKEAETLMERLVKDMRFLQSKKTRSAEEEKLLWEQAMEQASYQAVKTQCAKHLEEINAGIQDFSECELTIGMLYPPVTVTINRDTMVLDEGERAMCRIWSEDGEIK
ncbi:MAG: FapA family protein, partial [Hungatella sp.]